MTRSFIDLQIIDDDLAPDTGGEPLRVDGLNTIAQDIKHMIREKGFSIRMIGERNPQHIQLLQVQMQREIENDRRIVPGTVTIQRITKVELNRAQFLITAQTILGTIEVEA